MGVTIERYTDAPASYHSYDPSAPAVARLLADAITAAGRELAVEHFGSTAVPGCAGKGVIDLLVLYPPGQLPQAKRALDQLGFQRQTTRDPFPEDRPMRVGVVMQSGKPFRVHAHVLAVDAPEVAELRAFRDRLRAEPEFRSAYEASKRGILAAGVTDSVAYAKAKEEFIRGEPGNEKPGHSWSPNLARQDYRDVSLAGEYDGAMRQVGEGVLWITVLAGHVFPCRC